MRCSADVDASTRVATLVLSESCHTDSFPLVSELFFSGAEFDPSSAAFALACVVLARRHIGEQLEFAGHPVGIDTVRAIRRICPRLETISPVNGMNRSHSAPELDIVSCHARYQSTGVFRSDSVPLVHIDWSGDFVQNQTRSSEGFCIGRYFTNAGLIADETSVSIALALMHGGNSCRDLHVPVPEAGPGPDHLQLQDGLGIVGIKLHFMGRS